jgi:hypothetical protein
MSTDKERLELVLTHLRMNPNELAKSLGYSRTQRIYFVLNERNGISDSLARDICAKYPEISFKWLKNGIGDMINAIEDKDTSDGTTGASFGKVISSVAGTVVESAIDASTDCATGLSGLFGSFLGSIFGDNEDISEEEAVEVLRDALDDHKRISKENEELREEVEYWRNKANNLEYQLSKTKAG